MNNFLIERVTEIKDGPTYSFLLWKREERLMQHLRIKVDAHLTKREIQCLSCNLFGFSAKQIACILPISHRTVEAYLQKALHKLSCFSKLACLEKMHNLGVLWDWHELARRLLEESHIQF